MSYQLEPLDSKESLQSQRRLEQPPRPHLHGIHGNQDVPAPAVRNRVRQFRPRSAPGLKMNILGIALLHGRRTVIGLRDMSEIVIIDREDPRVAGVIAVPPL